MSSHSTTAPYSFFFYIIPYFFNFVKNFFTLITLDIINGNLFLARGLLHSTLITKWQSHFYFLLSLDFSYIIPHFSLFVKNFFIFFVVLYVNLPGSGGIVPSFTTSIIRPPLPTLNAFLPVQYILAINHIF